MFSFKFIQTLKTKKPFFKKSKILKKLKLNSQALLCVFYVSAENNQTRMQRISLNAVGTFFINFFF